MKIDRVIKKYGHIHLGRREFWKYYKNFKKALTDTSGVYGDVKKIRNLPQKELGPRERGKLCAYGIWQLEHALSHSPDVRETPLIIDALSGLKFAGSLTTSHRVGTLANSVLDKYLRSGKVETFDPIVKYLNSLNL